MFMFPIPRMSSRYLLLCSVRYTVSILETFLNDSEKVYFGTHSETLNEKKKVSYGMHSSGQKRFHFCSECRQKIIAVFKNDGDFGVALLRNAVIFHRANSLTKIVTVNL